MILAKGTVGKRTLALRQAQGERKQLSKYRPIAAQAEPVEAGFAQLSTLSFESSASAKGQPVVLHDSPLEPAD